MNTKAGKTARKIAVYSVIPFFIMMLCAIGRAEQTSANNTEFWLAILAALINAALFAGSVYLLEK